MPAVRVRTTLGPDTLKLPELAPLLGQEVFLAVTEADRLDVPPVDVAFLEECRAAVAAAERVPTLEEVRAMLAEIPGSLADDMIADREDRV